MLKRIVHLSIIMLAATAQLSAQPSSDLLQLSAKAIEALRAANSALDDLKNVQDVVLDIDNNRTPKVKTNNWSDLAIKYQTAAAKLKSAPLPTDFDNSKYAFSPSELSDCSTREQSLQKGRGYVAELQAAGNRGRTEVQKLDAALARTAKAREALDYLIKVHDKLIGVPIYGDIFKWDWFTLNTDVLNSLSDLDTALKQNKQKLSTEIAKVKSSETNLQSNLKLIESASVKCAFVGRWEGAANPPSGPAISFSIVITRSGDTFSATGSIEEESAPVSNLVLDAQNRTISFSWKDGSMNVLYRGILATDSLSIDGTATEGGDSSRLQLRKR
jgi:hypothetical protein